MHHLVPRSRHLALTDSGQSGQHAWQKRFLLSETSSRSFPAIILCEQTRRNLLTDPVRTGSSRLARPQWHTVHWKMSVLSCGPTKAVFWPWRLL